MAEQNKRLITAEDLYEFKVMSSPRISPDGRYVVYSVQRVDRKTEKKYSNLWIIPTEGGEPRPFTSGDQTDGMPRWSPDGRQIAFLSNRGNPELPPQLYLISMEGGEAHRIVDLEAEVENFAWSPDGQKIVCQARKLDPEVLEREKDENRKKLGTVSRHYDRLFYKLDGHGYLPHERSHVWTVVVNSGEAKQRTNHQIYDEREPAWSPDGNTIYFISNRSEDPDATFERDDIFQIPAEGGEMQKLSTPLGAKTKLSISPDGLWLAYLGTEGEGIGYRNQGLWVVPVDGSTPACNLLEGYDLHATAWTINDVGSVEDVPPIWSNDSQLLYFSTAEKGSSLLRKISHDGKNLSIVIGPGGVAASPSFDRDQTRLAYFYGTMTNPGQIFLRDMKTGQDRQLTHLNQELLDQIDLGKMEEVWFKGPDGNDLQGWILTPPGFDLSKKYPSILEIHGGPQTQYGNFFMHEFYYLAANGYVVYFTNPRGGRGYGEEHTKAIWRSWGGADYADLMAWTDYVEKLPYIDSNRMGVTGGSYGGYMTVWIIGHTDRFDAAVTQRCVSNFVSMWGSSDFNWTFQQELNDKPPFEDLQKYWEHSPIAYIGNAKTPTLVIHNENDHRCPIEQGEQVFVALKRLGIDTGFVRFPDEFHGLSRNGRTDRRIDRLDSILGWFDKYLKA